MKRYILPMLCIIVTGCVTQQERTERAQRLAAELEESKDVIKTIETYNDMYADCFSIDYSRIPNGQFEDFGVYNSICDRAIIQELSNPQIDLSCFYKNWGTEIEYKSDECIIQRRNHSLSRNGYFDYKRFLQKNTRIKTEEDWNYLVAFYNEDYCNSPLEELTEVELGMCKKQHKQTIIKLANSNSTQKCKSLLHRLARKNKINDLINWCGYNCHLPTILSQIQKYSTEHFCDINGLDTDFDLNSIEYWNYYRNELSDIATQFGDLNKYIEYYFYH